MGSEDSRILLRNITRDIRKEIYKYNTARWTSFLSTIQGSHKKNEKAFWSQLSKIYKPRSLPFSKLMVSAKTTSNEQEITKALYEHYREQAKSPDIDPSNTHDMQIETEYQELLNELSTNRIQSLEPTFFLEVWKLIKKMKGKKSSGRDQISNHIIKTLSPVYVDCLVNCFNVWLGNCKYPDFWKVAKIVTLNKLKAGIPNCNQTRPISLLSTHSKLFEKILLDRMRVWAEGNHLVPQEQSGFRANCLLQTRVLSIYQEIKNNLAANVPTLAIYVDYQKAFDLVWHKGLLVKLQRLGIPTNLLMILKDWLDKRTAYIKFGQTESDIYNIGVGLPQGSSLSPYIFVIYHCDLISCLGAHSGHLFADDLSVLIRAPIAKAYAPLVKYLEMEGSRVCEKIYEYSNSWKQPINIGKTVAQVFYSQIEKPMVDIRMRGHKIAQVDTFKYLGFTWSSKLSLKSTVDKCIENAQRSLSKLKWLRCGKILSKITLRKCFFAYTFPHLAWLFPFFPFLPRLQQEALRGKFRVGMRLIHRVPFLSSLDLFPLIKEEPLDNYVKRYISKRLKKMSLSDLGTSLFYTDTFFWDSFYKRPNDGVGHLFCLKRVNKLKSRHRSLILDWFDFIS